MGNFQHHVGGGVCAAGVCGGVAWQIFQLPVADSLAAAILCGIGSILPDIDSPQSKPTQILFHITSILAPYAALQLVGFDQLTPSEALLVALATFFVVRYGLQKVLETLAVHRGIIHSIPFGALWGCLIYYLFRKAPAISQNWIAGSAFIGFMVHLFIDEMFSFANIDGLKLAPKASFGTAFKVIAPSFVATTATYIVLGIAIYYCLTL